VRPCTTGSARRSIAEASRSPIGQSERPDQPRRFNLDRNIDNIVTSPIWGFPMMFLLLMGVFWLTIAGANVPSACSPTLLTRHRSTNALHNGAAAIAMPAWLSGLLIDGVYLATAWVVSVMLPPMAIFFPLFTLLEDFGYLPRVAFNLDRLFKSVPVRTASSRSR
jgi:ferrous iron transport protein B